MNKRRNGSLILSLLALLLLADLRGLGAPDPGHTPFMGWSSWSLEATKYPGYDGENWLTAEHIEQQSDALHRTLQSHGYTYINMDSGWRDGIDAYGRPAPDRKKFPEGVVGVARYVHRNGQKLGIYWIPGVMEEVYKANPQILGSTQHIQDIVVKPLQPATGWGFGYKIDYRQPGAQAYVNSIAAQFAAWGVDFLKLDGVTPGSDRTDLSIDSRPDVAAWSAALKRTKRPIWLELSWNLDPTYLPTWQKYAQGWRITDDVDSYGPTLTGWSQISRPFSATLLWANAAGPGKGWNDLDSLDVGCGAMDGLTLDERRTAVTLWAISCSPLYTGDDLTKLDTDGLALLTNDEVIAVDQAGHPASPLLASEGRIWVSANGDGSKTVAVFNRSPQNAVVRLTRQDLGLRGVLRVRDLWGHVNMGVLRSSTAIALSPHACRLFRVVAVGSRPHSAQR